MEHYLICSFTDAVSREVIAERGVHEVLTLGAGSFAGAVSVFPSL